MQVTFILFGRGRAPWPEGGGGLICLASPARDSSRQAGGPSAGLDSRLYDLLYARYTWPTAPTNEVVVMKSCLVIASPRVTFGQEENDKRMAVYTLFFTVPSTKITKELRVLAHRVSQCSHLSRCYVAWADQTSDKKKTFWRWSVENRPRNISTPLRWQEIHHFFRFDIDRQKTPTTTSRTLNEARWLEAPTHATYSSIAMLTPRSVICGVGGSGVY